MCQWLPGLYSVFFIIMNKDAKKFTSSLFEVICFLSLRQMSRSGIAGFKLTVLCIPTQGLISHCQDEMEAKRVGEKKVNLQ